MDDTTVLGSALGQVGLTAKKVGQQMVKLPGEMSKDLSEQAGMPNSREPQQAQNAGWQSDEERIKFLKGLYGQSDAPKASEQVASSLDKKPTEFQEQIKDKAPEEQKELVQLRNQLHKEEYYDPAFDPVKKQEERPAEKVENEKKMEMQDLQQKEADKPQPLAVQREQNRVEMPKGVSG